MSEIGNATIRKAVEEHYGVLDGWRGVSILLVLWGHLFPAGPKGWRLNETVASTGMVLFFTLSGFLITSFLFKRADVLDFLIRRLARILPLAWLYVVVVLLAVGSTDAPRWLAHLFFYGNLPPFWLISPTSHLWSLSVEMHFYIGVAILVAALGRRGLWLLPLLCLAVTANRAATGTFISIVTWLRVDEILGGAALALVFHHRDAVRTILPHWSLSLVFATLLLASSHPGTGALQFARPYLSALLIGTTLFNEHSRLAVVLKGRVLGYFAKVSYALYVIHGGLRYTWLGSGEGWAKYAKRPLLLVVTFGLSHLSTFYYEARAIAAGRSLSHWLRRRRAR